MRGTPRHISTTTLRYIFRNGKEGLEFLLDATELLDGRIMKSMLGHTYPFPMSMGLGFPAHLARQRSRVLSARLKGHCRITRLRTSPLMLRNREKCYSSDISFRFLYCKLLVDINILWATGLVVHRARSHTIKHEFHCLRGERQFSIKFRR